MPNVGASGAIAGVLGGIPPDVPAIARECNAQWQIVAMPAVIVLGLWIVLHLFSGVGTIAYTDETR